MPFFRYGWVLVDGELSYAGGVLGPEVYVWFPLDLEEGVGVKECMYPRVRVCYSSRLLERRVKNPKREGKGKV
jgi:hypothetical protein